ncbi:1-phosphofructokinase family hexose kinase [Xanthomonas translucens]|uniref:Phosphofructokinase n=6 Tax=Xanthomonas campestris pv. translucens TaxID=343 RepID=A0A1C3TN70_XANCT|nr:1-phosphofructokinase family hexose kinase [Xanthomonas translucens]MCT8285312.1 1-phosphofructokinase family hexose kinase [Xanthomonas translucens pv. translucens]MCT8302970.1 1-phosphofructokinase family hexose kinase [Xanthomonas translucens pv. translucens]QSQ29336.1 1-phosphofructokinase family hexose kinase [Xanthomonas translucens pv. translucens]QSQ35442.1 1-phosphofructokinase family hexose kinase [Xanthomonas translucens pv. translucens]QSQ44244.1 1-phosphofructokinase family hex
MSVQAVSVSLNPAIDLTVAIDRLQPGQVHRASSAHAIAGGKGINVAACLADAGIATAALGVLGAGNAHLFETLFAARGIDDRCLRVSGDTRTNLKLVAADSGATTDINLPGLPLGAAELQAVGARLDELLRPGLPVVLTGSLPAGLAADSWRTLQAQAATAGARVLLDTSGAPLRAALAAPRAQLPFAIKPNRHELEDWAGTPLHGTADVLAATRALQASGIALVVVSLGTDGALFVRGEQALLAHPPQLAGGSSVGAGDAMVAGLVAALLAEADLATCARQATAFAVATLGSGAARRLPREQVAGIAAAVRIEALQ